MAKKHTRLDISKLDQLSTTGAGYDVLRYISLPDVLGTEAETLLYFMGKNLARKLQAETMHDLFYLFEKMGWGRLDFVKEKRKELIFTLMSDAVVQRLKAPFEADFRLEAGFLSETLGMIKGRTCECSESVNPKIHQVVFTVVYTDI
ncbi:YslB family protein [Lentibacillus saliphilus]|uniref:YslB family protein n=1 Tax=Lentibacillus saliphilus TaxID=2737028 RepID=UPI001C309B32|nr:YslB family protein [Lentibacillus saliphilus]